MRDILFLIIVIDLLFVIIRSRVKNLNFDILI